jgi:O-succinylbenzoate synthase
LKITHITLHHLRMNLKAPFETSFGRIDTRDCVLIGAHADGLIGWGECVADRDPGYSYETSGTAWLIIKDFIAPLVLGQDISSPSNFHSLVDRVRGHLMAKSGVEMALWDLQGKREERSLRDMLGGKLISVDVGVSVGIQSNPEVLVKTVGDYLAQGYRRVKIKIKPGRDVAEVMTVRKVFPNIRLQVDANSAYTLDTAASLLPLDEIGLLLIEQPLFEDDLWDHSKLQRQFNTPLCLDESILSTRHARQAIEMEACRVINIKTGRVGGLSQAVAIHDLCSQHDIPVWCGGMLETGVGRAANLALASLPNFKLPGDISATDRYYDEDITDQRFALNQDSTIDVPNLPGLGVTINPQSLARVTINKTTLTELGL